MATLPAVEAAVAGASKIMGQPRPAAADPVPGTQWMGDSLGQKQTTNVRTQDETDEAVVAAEDSVRSVATTSLGDALMDNHNKAADLAREGLAMDLPKLAKMEPAQMRAMIEKHGGASLPPRTRREVTSIALAQILQSKGLWKGAFPPGYTPLTTVVKPIKEQMRELQGQAIILADGTSSTYGAGVERMFNDGPKQVGNNLFGSPALTLRKPAQTLEEWAAQGENAEFNTLLVDRNQNPTEVVEALREVLETSNNPLGKELRELKKLLRLNAPNVAAPQQAIPPGEFGSLNGYNDLVQGIDLIFKYSDKAVVLNIINSLDQFTAHQLRLGLYSVYSKNPTEATKIMHNLLMYVIPSNRFDVVSLHGLSALMISSPEAAWRVMEKQIESLADMKSKILANEPMSFDKASGMFRGRFNFYKKLAMYGAGLLVLGSIWGVSDANTFGIVFREQIMRSSLLVETASNALVRSICESHIGKLLGRNVEDLVGPEIDIVTKFNDQVYNTTSQPYYAVGMIIVSYYSYFYNVVTGNPTVLREDLNGRPRSHAYVSKDNEKYLASLLFTSEARKRVLEKRAALAVADAAGAGGIVRGFRDLFRPGAEVFKR